MFFLICMWEKLSIYNSGSKQNAVSSKTALHFRIQAAELIWKIHQVLPTETEIVFSFLMRTLFSPKQSYLIFPQTSLSFLQKGIRACKTCTLVKTHRAPLQRESSIKWSIWTEVAYSKHTGNQNWITASILVAAASSGRRSLPLMKGISVSEWEERTWQFIFW